MIEFSRRAASRLALLCCIVLIFATACSRSDDRHADDQSHSSIADSRSASTNGSGKAVWAINRSLVDAKLFRIDPAARRITHKITLDGAPRGIAAGEGAVWVTDFSYDKVLKINPKSMRVEAAISVDKAPTSILTAGGSVWVISNTEGILTRIDPASNKIVSRIHITNSVLTGLAYSENAVWVPSVDFLVTRVDPGSDSIAAKIHVTGNPGSTVVAGGNVWVLNPSFKQLIKIDPATNKATTIALSKAVRFISSGRDTLWLAEDGGMVSRFDIGSAGISSSFKAAGEVSGLCLGDDTLWVASGPENKVFAVEP
ncbi:MAG: hypothetical protein LLG06_07850, partial [Desulfobacteraceae bacterium]|nr:hypothetical protein [Desulfobacteraceae bacterium]